MKLSKQTLFAIIAIVVIVAISIYFSLSLKKTPQVNFVAVNRQDVTQAVTADGMVQSSQELSLAFQQGGTVSAVDVQDGDTVKQGQVLLKLDTQTAASAVAQAQAALASAQANYEKVVNGATDASIDVSQAAVTSAQTALTNAQNSQTQTVAQQNLLVKNAQGTLFNSNLAATPSPSNTSTIVPLVTGAYTGTTPGQYQVKIFSTGANLQFNTTGLENANGVVSTAPVALGTMGLFISFPGTVYTNDTWTINLPNTEGSSYLANYNAYQTALQNQSQMTVSAQAAVDSAQAALTQAQAALTLAQTPARPEDIDAAKAQVEEASAQAQTAETNLSQDVITAPIDGVITSVDTKVGETVAGSSLAPGPDAVKMISAANFQIIAYLSETDIGKIKVGDAASTTLDAYGSGTDFPATVIAIDPGSTVQNGIATYKTTLQFNNNDSRIKDGMDASITIVDQTHQGVLAVPSTAIITNNNQTFVLTQGANGKTQQTQVQTGITGQDGMVEIVSGLSQGQEVAEFGNQ